MKNIRSCIKIFLLIVFTLITYAVYFSVYLILRLFRRPFEPWRNFYMRGWSKGVVRILNIQISVNGTPPKPPFILISNHLSYVDILPMFINMRCTFVAKKEVESWPILGYMVKKTGVIFVDRSVKKDVKRVNELLAESLNKYQGIVLFPEGTTSGGDKVLPFRSSLLNYPASDGIPVTYSVLQYRTSDGDLPAEESVCFYGAREPFHKHIFKLAGNRKIECRVVYSDETVRATDRKELAEKLNKKVNSAVHTLRKEMGYS